MEYYIQEIVPISEEIFDFDLPSDSDAEDEVAAVVMAGATETGGKSEVDEEEEEEEEKKDGEEVPPFPDFTADEWGEIEREAYRVIAAIRQVQVKWNSDDINSPSIPKSGLSLTKGSSKLKRKRELLNAIRLRQSPLLDISNQSFIKSNKSLMFLNSPSGKIHENSIVCSPVLAKCDLDFDSLGLVKPVCLNFDDVECSPKRARCFNSFMSPDKHLPMLINETCDMLYIDSPSTKDLELLDLNLSLEGNVEDTIKHPAPGNTTRSKIVGSSTTTRTTTTTTTTTTNNNNKQHKIFSTPIHENNCNLNVSFSMDQSESLLTKLGDPLLMQTPKVLKVVGGTSKKPTNRENAANKTTGKYQTRQLKNFRNKPEVWSDNGKDSELNEEPISALCASVLESPELSTLEDSNATETQAFLSQSFTIDSKKRPLNQSFTIDSTKAPLNQSFTIDSKKGPSIEFCAETRNLGFNESYTIENNNTVSNESFTIESKNMPSNESYTIENKNMLSNQSFTIESKNMPSNQSYTIESNNTVSNESFTIESKNMPSNESYTIENKNMPSNQSFTIENKNMTSNESFTIENKNMPSNESYTIENKNMPSNQSYTIENKNMMSNQSFTIENNNTVSNESFTVESNNTVSNESFTVEPICPMNESYTVETKEETKSSLKHSSVNENSNAGRKSYLRKSSSQRPTVKNPPPERGSVSRSLTVPVRQNTSNTTKNGQTLANKSSSKATTTTTTTTTTATTTTTTSADSVKKPAQSLLGISRKRPLESSRQSLAYSRVNPKANADQKVVPARTSYNLKKPDIAFDKSVNIPKDKYGMVKFQEKSTAAVKKCKPGVASSSSSSMHSRLQMLKKQATASTATNRQPVGTPVSDLSKRKCVIPTPDFKNNRLRATPVNTASTKMTRPVKLAEPLLPVEGSKMSKPSQLFQKGPIRATLKPEALKSTGKLPVPASSAATRSRLPMPSGSRIPQPK